MRRQRSRRVSAPIVRMSPAILARGITHRSPTIRDRSIQTDIARARPARGISILLPNLPPERRVFAELRQPTSDFEHTRGRLAVLVSA